MNTEQVEEIETNIDSGQTSWIYTLNKQTLKAICVHYKIPVSAKASIEDLRKLVANFTRQKSSHAVVGTEIDAEASGSTSHEIQNQTFKMTAPWGQMEPFQKQGNWASFADPLEAFIILNNVQEEKKMALLLTRLSTQVFEELRAACEPQSLITLSYSQVKTKLTSLYSPASNVCLLRFTFRERKQRQNETIQEYVQVLRSLAQKCKFVATEINSHIKDQLISGVNHQLMRYELLKASNKTLDELAELAKTVEMAENRR